MTQDNKFPEIIEKLAKVEEGKKDKKDVMAFTLSTCQWCKKCKRYLKDNDIQYRYIDVDQITPQEKMQILNYLRDNYQERISYPFLVCDDKFVVGYDPNKYDEIFEEDD
ncbi:MAG: NrdH-redoxin (modular protein) [Promethearchaeota archaeon]|nr:MAG: NrdH-redoxin (modular protein) [Candidatus Lokiarchaeota archaeon]